MKRLFFSKLVAISACMLVVGFFIGYGYSLLTVASQKIPANKPNDSINLQSNHTNMPMYTIEKNIIH